MGKRTTQIRTTPAAAEAWRSIAAAFELFVSRGVGTDEVGAPAAALERIAARFQRDPVGTLRALGPLLVEDA